jgi:membrane-associated phospholipid phosphatase
MKLDTSSYYPKSNLDDVEEEIEAQEAAEKAAETDAATIPVPAEEDPEYDEDAVRDDIGMEDIPQYESRIIDGVSRFLSWVLVPLMMPIYGIILAFNFSILSYVSPVQKLVFTVIVAAFNLLIPSLAVLIMKHLGLIKDVGLNHRRERTLPYIVTILCMAATGVFLYYKGAPMWLAMFFGGGTLAGIFELLINFRWKISAHSAGIAGVVALLLRIMQDGVPQSGLLTCFMVAIALSGLLGSARIWLGRHTIWQVAGGYAVGFCSVYFLTMIH